MCNLKESSRVSRTPTPVTTPGFGSFEVSSEGSASSDDGVSSVSSVGSFSVSSTTVNSTLGQVSEMNSQRQPINSENPGNTSSRHLHRKLVVRSL